MDQKQRTPMAEELLFTEIPAQAQPGTLGDTLCREHSL